MIIDLHCDTITNLKGQSLACNDLAVDLNKLIAGNYLMQVFAIFTNLKKVSDPYLYCLEHINLYNRLVKDNKLINPIYKLADFKDNTLNSLLAIEETGVIGNDINKLDELYRLGVRMATLTWNYPNSIGYPHTDNEKGLSAFGFEVIKKCEELGIIVDVSHLGEKAFWDLIAVTTKPLIASHANCRSITNHSRNLTDEMIKAIASKGGVIGVNYCADFLGEKVATVAAIIKHIKHLVSVGGINCVALGSDFDGIDNEVEFKDASGIKQLVDCLYDCGFSEEEIKKITQDNFLKVLKECIK